MEEKEYQILMFGGKQPMLVTTFYPKRPAKVCPQCKKPKTDYIGICCVDCMTDSNLNKNGGKTK